MPEVELLRLPVHSMLPSFTLETTEGGDFSTWSVKGSKNLVIFVFGKVCNPECQILLARAAREYKRYRESNAEVLAVFKMNREYADDIKHELALPFPVLVDLDGMVVSRLLYQPPGIFVTDRYGEVVAEFLDEEVGNVKNEQILARVELNELECPECGV